MEFEIAVLRWQLLTMEFGVAVLPLAIRHAGIWDVLFDPDNFL